jgi:hypothetical protein
MAQGGNRLDQAPLKGLVKGEQPGAAAPGRQAETSRRTQRFYDL